MCVTGTASAVGLAKTAEHNPSFGADNALKIHSVEVVHQLVEFIAVAVFESH